MPIGKRIKEIRKTQGVTQKEFSERVCVTQSYISRLESDKEIPTDMLIKLIALEFNISKQWLVDGVSSMYDFTEDDEFYRDSATQGAVNSSLAHLFETLASDTTECSEYEKKMILDILIELKHVLKLKVSFLSQKTAAIEMIRNSLCYSSLFIDNCASIDKYGTFEKKRIEERKQKTIKDYEGFIDEVTNVFMCQSDS